MSKNDGDADPLDAEQIRVHLRQCDFGIGFGRNVFGFDIGEVRFGQRFSVELARRVQGDVIEDHPHRRHHVHRQ